ncbi:TolC family protein, partial [Aeromonas caviae]
GYHQSAVGHLSPFIHECRTYYLNSRFADEIYAENTLENSYEALRELTGLEHRKLNKLDTERFSPQKTLWKIDKWTDAAIEKNLALHQARIKKELAKMQIDLSKSGHKPLVDLTMGLSSTYNNYKDNTVNTDGYSNQGDIGIKFSLPLYTGGATASQVKQSSFDYVAASEQLEKSYRSVMSAVKSSYNNVNASIGAVRAYQQAVVSAESALKATEAGYEVGTRTIIDVLDANRKLYDAKTKLAISRYSYIVNVATLKLNSGSLGKKEIIDIDNGLVNLR